VTPFQSSPDVDVYIEEFTGDRRKRLNSIRQLLRELVPQGEERISYKMPAVFYQGVVVYYAAFKKHIGLFPPVADESLLKKVAPYAGPKGNLQFPHDEELPLKLIGAVVKARLNANLKKEKK
jgi:uncharacterized protein YdhG (YjbR/CyaY superfamily)